MSALAIEDCRREKHGSPLVRSPGEVVDGVGQHGYRIGTATLELPAS
jgi:hypothetical protein